MRTTDPMKIFKLAEELSYAAMDVSQDAVRVAAGIEVADLRLAHNIVILNDTMIDLARALGLQEPARLDP